MKSLSNLLRTIYMRLTADGSTEEQAIRSGIWVLGINIGDRGLQLVKVIILARLLSPAAFGLIGIALLTITAFRQFSQLGFDQALIHHQNENVDEYLNTAWVIKIIRGIIIALVAFLISPLLAILFSEPQAKPLIRVLGILPLILGLQNPAVVYFQKNLNFHKEFVYQVGSRVVDLCVAIIFALIYQNVWALVAGLIASNATMCMISYAIHKYRPSVSFNMEYGKEMFGFGKWLLISGFLIFLYGQGDDAFVGWYFGATALGLYQLAYQFSNAPATEITQVISRVAFPTFSKVQENKEQLRNGYFRVIQLSTLIAFPVAAGIIAVASQFVYVFLGEQWAPTIVLIQGLAIWGGLRALGANVGPVFKAVGRPDIETKLQAIKVAIIALTIYPASEYFGLIGVVYVIVGNTIITHPLSYYLVLNIIGESVYRFILQFIYPLFASSLMLLIVVGTDELLFSTHGIIPFILLVITGVITYVLVIFGLQRFSAYDLTPLYSTIRDAV